MIGSPASKWPVALCASMVLVALPMVVHAQGNAPIRLAPPRPLVTAPQPAPEVPAEVAPTQRLPAFPGISVEDLGSVAGEAVGAIGPRQGGFGAALWSGADRAMVERLVPRLPARSPSRVIRDLTRVGRGPTRSNSSRSSISPAGSTSTASRWSTRPGWRSRRSTRPAV